MSADSQTPPGAPPAAQVEPAVVLVATSDAATRELLLKAVRLSGVTVVQAVDGLEALALARRMDLHVAVLDTFLAVLDGATTCARIRNLSVARQPSILVAGVTGERMAELAFEAGADDVARKPLHVGVLRRRVAGLLDRKRSEARLRLLERATEVAMSGITILDARTPDFPVRYANATFARMTGYSKSELQGRNLRLLVGPETDLAALSEMREAMLQGRACRSILKNYRKDGTTFWNELSMAPMRDEVGLLTHWVGIQTDASVRVRAGELALAQQELEDLVELRTRELADVLATLERRRLFTEAVLNALTGGVITTDPRGAVSFANRTALELLKLSPSDCVGKPVTEILQGSEELERALAEPIDRERRGLDCDVTSPSGASLRVGIALVPAPEEFREELGLLLLFRDLREKQEAEARAASLAAPSRDEPEGVQASPEPEDASPVVPSEPSVELSPQLLLRRAIEALRGRPASARRRPLVENPLRVFPPVRVQERPVVEALLAILEAGLETIGESGRLRVRVEVPDPGPAEEIAGPGRLAIALTGEAGFSPVWTKGADVNLQIARQLLEGCGGGVRTSASPEGQWRIEVLLPLAEPGSTRPPTPRE